MSSEAPDACYRYIGARAAGKLPALTNRGADGFTAKCGLGPFPVSYRYFINYLITLLVIFALSSSEFVPFSAFSPFYSAQFVYKTWCIHRRLVYTHATCLVSYYIHFRHFEPHARR